MPDRLDLAKLGRAVRRRRSDPHRQREFFSRILGLAPTQPGNVTLELRRGEVVVRLALPPSSSLHVKGGAVDVQVTGGENGNPGHTFVAIKDSNGKIVKTTLFAEQVLAVSGIATLLLYPVPVWTVLLGLAL